ncbi:hypothetical protein GQR58_026675 [Nymphon striatum]|nr:hypothetical protein GQR58_026675 [Nymphon striatum]
MSTKNLRDRNSVVKRLHDRARALPVSAVSKSSRKRVPSEGVNQDQGKKDEDFWTPGKKPPDETRRVNRDPGEQILALLGEVFPRNNYITNHLTLRCVSFRQTLCRTLLENSEQFHGNIFRNDQNKFGGDDIRPTSTGVLRFAPSGILFGATTHSRKGRPRKSWEKSLKETIRPHIDRNAGDWWDLAQDRAKWRALSRATMGLQGLSWCMADKYGKCTRKRKPEIHINLCVLVEVMTKAKLTHYFVHRFMNSKATLEKKTARLESLRRVINHSRECFKGQSPQKHENMHRCSVCSPYKVFQNVQLSPMDMKPPGYANLFQKDLLCQVITTEHIEECPELHNKSLSCCSSPKATPTFVVTTTISCQQFLCQSIKYMEVIHEGFA